MEGAAGQVVKSTWKAWTSATATLSIIPHLVFLVYTLVFFFLLLLLLLFYMFYDPNADDVQHLTESSLFTNIFG